MAGFTDGFGQLARNFLWTFRWSLAVATVVTICLLGVVLSSRNRAKADESEAESQRQHQVAETSRRASEAESKERIARIAAQDKASADAVKEAKAELDRKHHAELAEKERQANAVAEAKRRAAEAKAAKVAAVAEAEAEKRKHIARNLRSTETFRTPGLLAVAVAVANPEGRLDESLTAQLASLLPPARVNASGGLFTPAFVADGMLHKLLASESSELVRLGLPTLTDYLLLGTYRVQFSTNTQFGGFVTASLQFEASVLKSATGVVQETISDTMSGAGVDTEKAESAAKERLIKSLSTRPWRFLAQ